MQGLGIWNSFQQVSPLAGYGMNGILPLAVLDFSAGMTTVPLVFSRASSATVPTVNGAWMFAARDEPRHDYRLGIRSLLIEGAASNLIAAYAAPTDLTGVALRSGSPGTLSVVADITEQAAAGISGITNGKAYLLDNRTGTTTATMIINGPFATDQDFAASVWLRAGTSGIAPTIRTGYGIYTVHDAPAGTAYSRAYFAKSDLKTGEHANQDLLWVRVPAGGTVYVALPQAEQGAAQPSSYIRTVGAPASRAADIPSLTGLPAKAFDVRVVANGEITELLSEAVNGDYWPSAAVGRVEQIEIYNEGTLS